MGQRKKKAKKITEKFLGTITHDGLIEPKQERAMKSLDNISVKEFGDLLGDVGKNKNIL